MREEDCTLRLCERIRLGTLVMVGNRRLGRASINLSVKIIMKNTYNGEAWWVLVAPYVPRAFDICKLSVPWPIRHV